MNNIKSMWNRKKPDGDDEYDVQVVDMNFVPHTKTDINSMLHEIGKSSIEDLFSHIPAEMRLKKELSLPEPLSEMKLVDHLGRLSSSNAQVKAYNSFLGAGAYHHYIPAVVGNLVARSEFLTSYTPYQPEVSQGTLQAIFEYQTLMCMLTGMEISNASLYDGATASAEAALMSVRTTKRKRVFISRSVNPDFRAVIKTYLQSNDCEIVDVPYSETGETDLAVLKERIDDTVAGVIIQSPNFFGVVENLQPFGNLIHSAGAQFIATFTEPVAYGLLKPPGAFGADIACGEGQSFGLPVGFGGPYLGILTCTRQLLRTLPGRVVGKTVDREGRTAYVLTLAAREQHIRRERATSNICTNQSLCALTASIFLSALGKQGYRDLSVINHDRAEYAKREITKIDSISLRFNGPTFNEFVIRCSRDPIELEKKLLEKRILPGILLGRYDESLSDCMLVTVTEMNSVSDIDVLCEALRAL